MANTLVGSVIAIVSVAPDRESGMIWYFCAVSAGISLMTAGSISNWPIAIEGTPNCLLRSAVISASLTKPSETSVKPELAALLALLGQRLLQLLRGDALLFEKQIAEADGHDVSLDLAHVHGQATAAAGRVRMRRAPPRPSRARRGCRTRRELRP